MNNHHNPTLHKQAQGTPECRVGLEAGLDAQNPGLSEDSILALPRISTMSEMEQGPIEASEECGFVVGGAQC